MPDVSTALAKEVEWLSAMIADALALFLTKEGDTPDLISAAPPALENDTSDYAEIIREHDLDPEDRLILILALAAALEPQALDPFLIRNSALDQGFTEFGGHRLASGGFVPSVQTAAFLLAGQNMMARLAVARRLCPGGKLIDKDLVELEPNDAQTLFSHTIRPAEPVLSRLVTGGGQVSRLSVDFPAQNVTTNLEWDDLIVSGRTLSQLEEILSWNTFGAELRNQPGPGRMIAPGYRSLFYGPPGTGKTLAATLLGQRAQRPVFRVDLSLTVSKWIGETEKNLSRMFDEAERRGWILFFDEADALFGKRTSVSAAHDRYANQDVAYILQRVEYFQGILLVASNLKSNMDEAFMRRFQSVIHFAPPNTQMRAELWHAAFKDSNWAGGDVDIDALAKTHELTGGAIVNVLRAAMLAAFEANRRHVTMRDLERSIQREFRKEARVQEHRL